MERMKTELEREAEDMSDELEEEEEEEEQEEEVEDDKPDEFEMLKAKVKAKLPRKIAAKGIVSNLRPIEEESVDDMSQLFESGVKQRTENQERVEPPIEAEFKNMTNDEKRKEIQRMMRVPNYPQNSVEEAKNDDEGNDQSSMSEEQSNEIQRRLGKTILILNVSNVLYSKHNKYDSS